MGFFKSVDFQKKSIVFYGVSVGEVIAMENLIRKMSETFSQYKIVVMTGTVTGQEIARKKLSDVADLITYFPLDFPPFIENSMRKLNPAMVLVMETELWPNFANYTHKKNIPLYVVNGRISDRTYKSYKRFSFFFAPILRKYSGIFTQSGSDNQKLISIGANPDTTTVMGNLKFDTKKINSEMFFGGNGRIIVAGSTHSGEDELVLGVFKGLKRKFPDIKLIIAPRHPERNVDVYNLCVKTGLRCGKRSDNASFDDKDIILLNSMGELGKTYAISYLAFIGGSFNKTGGHNPLEATIFNKPVVSGRSIHNFKDIYALLTASGAAKIVNSEKELMEYFEKMLSDDEFYRASCADCARVFDENRGALNFVIDRISEEQNKFKSK